MTLLKALKAMSIRQKLMLIMMATSGLAIFLMALLVVINQAVNSQRAIGQQLITLADVLGSRSTGALTFDDPATAAEILNGLALKSHVIYAVIEEANGACFAEFGAVTMCNEAQQLNSPKVANASSTFLTALFSNEIQVARDINLENERIGRIRIVSTLDALYDDLLNYMIVLAVISLLCFSVSFIVCARLQKVVSVPIMNLQKAIDTVSDNKDYSLRVENTEESELKALINGFNHMLEQIQTRDTKLADNSQHLEKNTCNKDDTAH